MRVSVRRENEGLISANVGVTCETTITIEGKLYEARLAACGRSGRLDRAVTIARRRGRSKSLGDTALHSVHIYAWLGRDVNMIFTALGRLPAMSSGF